MQARFKREVKNKVSAVDNQAEYIGTLEKELQNLRLLHEEERSTLEKALASKEALNTQYLKCEASERNLRQAQSNHESELSKIRNEHSIDLTKQKMEASAHQTKVQLRNHQELEAQKLLLNQKIELATVDRVMVVQTQLNHLQEICALESTSKQSVELLLTESRHAHQEELHSLHQQIAISKVSEDETLAKVRREWIQSKSLMNQQMQALENKLKDCTNSLQAQIDNSAKTLENDVISKQKMENSLRDANESHRKDFDLLDQQIDNSQRQNVLLHRELKELNDRNALVCEENRRLAELKSQNTITSEALKNELDNVRNTSAEYQKEITKLENELNILSENHDRIQSSRLEQHDYKIECDTQLQMQAASHEILMKIHNEKIVDMELAIATAAQDAAREMAEANQVLQREIHDSISKQSESTAQLESEILNQKKLENEIAMLEIRHAKEQDSLMVQLAKQRDASEQALTIHQNSYTELTLELTKAHQQLLNDKELSDSQLSKSEMQQRLAVERAKLAEDSLYLKDKSYAEEIASLINETDKLRMEATMAWSIVEQEKILTLQSVTANEQTNLELKAALEVQYNVVEETRVDHQNTKSQLADFTKKCVDLELQMETQSQSLNQCVRSLQTENTKLLSHLNECEIGHKEKYQSLLKSHAQALDAAAVSNATLQKEAQIKGDKVVQEDLQKLERQLENSTRSLDQALECATNHRKSLLQSQQEMIHAAQRYDTLKSEHQFISESSKTERDLMQASNEKLRSELQTEHNLKIEMSKLHFEEVLNLMQSYHDNLTSANLYHCPDKDIATK